MKASAALVLTLFFAAGTHAALPDSDDGRLHEGPSLESSRQSWLLDNTNSGFGAEFFRAFAMHWRQQEAGALVISVQESRTTYFGHQISIWAGERLLLQTRFYPSQRMLLQSIAESTATAAAERLAQWQAQGVPTP